MYISPCLPVSPWLNKSPLWLLPLSFLAIFFFFPLSRILALTFNIPNSHCPENFQLAIPHPAFYLLPGRPLHAPHTAPRSALRFLFARYDFRGKSFLRALTAVPFMLPTVVVASGFNALLGPRGLISLCSLSSFLSFNLHRLHPFTAILLAHVFYNTTIVIRIVGNALSSLDPKLEQAARSLGADPFRVWIECHPASSPSLLARRRPACLSV